MSSNEQSMERQGEVFVVYSKDGLLDRAFVAVEDAEEWMDRTGGSAVLLLPLWKLGS